MAAFRAIGTFADAAAASRAIAALAATGVPESAVTLVPAQSPNATAREARFMGRIVLIVLFWSIIGTAVGAGFGALIALTIGPSGTEGLLIQTVSWAVFAHLLIGMWAGYLLLADRTGADLPAVRAGSPVLVTVLCANIEDARSAEDTMRRAGATALAAEEDERIPTETA